MTDREKVIRGLECCTQHGSMSGRNCNGHWGYTDASHTRMELIGEYRAGCTYGSCETGCVKTLAKDALALLKAQEPCEDAVSRKDVINVLQSPCDMRYVNGNWHPCIGDYIEAITNLSAVAPKAQGPVEPVMFNGEPECGACRYELRPDADSYCPCCGRKVNWE